MEERKGNLVVSRRVGQRLLIGDDITLTVVTVKSNGAVRMAINAPKGVRILREEVPPNDGLPSSIPNVEALGFVKPQ